MNQRKPGDRIKGPLPNLGHPVPGRTVGNILKAHGIEPAPDRRRSTRKSFLNAHLDVLASGDITTIGVWTRSGWSTGYLQFFMQLSTRRVRRMCAQ